MERVVVLFFFGNADEVFRDFRSGRGYYRNHDLVNCDFVAGDFRRDGLFERGNSNGDFFDGAFFCDGVGGMVGAAIAY